MNGHTERPDLEQYNKQFRHGLPPVQSWEEVSVEELIQVLRIMFIVQELLMERKQNK